MPRWLIIALVAFFVMLLLFVTACVGWRLSLGREVARRVAKIHAAVLPADWEELSKWPSPVPDSENAAFIYTNAIAHLHAEALTNKPYLQLPYRTHSMTAQERQKLADFVETNQIALELIYSASNPAQSRYPIVYADGNFALLPHLGGLKRIANLLAAKAVLESEAANSAAAAETVKTSLAVTRSLENEPLLLSQLTSIGMLRITALSLERVLCRASLAEPQLAELQQDFTLADATNRMLTGLIGERAMEGELLRLAQEDVRKFVNYANAHSGGNSKPIELRVDPSAGFRALGFFERDRNFYLRVMDANIELIATGPPPSLAMETNITRFHEEARKKLYVLSSLALSGMTKVGLRDAELHATLRTAIAAIAVERWRGAHSGVLPASLDDLVPSLLTAVSEDPFDGKPLRYKIRPDGFVVYSIGEDLHDDGGKERPSVPAKSSTGKTNLFDLTFTIER